MPWTVNKQQNYAIVIRSLFLFYLKHIHAHAHEHTVRLSNQQLINRMGLHTSLLNKWNINETAWLQKAGFYATKLVAHLKLSSICVLQKSGDGDGYSHCIYEIDFFARLFGYSVDGTTSHSFMERPHTLSSKQNSILKSTDHNKTFVWSSNSR